MTKRRWFYISILIPAIIATLHRYRLLEPLKAKYTELVKRIEYRLVAPDFIKRLIQLVVSIVTKQLNELVQAVKLVVKPKESQVKKQNHLVIHSNNLIFWNPSPDPSTPNYAFKEGSAKSIDKIHSDHPHHLITLITQVHSDKEQTQVEAILADTLPPNSPLDARRVLFCDTKTGLQSMTRFLQPHVFVTSDGKVAEKAAEVVERVVLVQRELPSPSPASSPKSQSGNTEVVSMNALSESDGQKLKLVAAVSPSSSTATLQSLDRIEFCESLAELSGML